MTASIGNQTARIVSDGFHLFAYKPTQMASLIIPALYLMQTPMSIDSIEIFRSFRIGMGKLRHDKTNMTYEVYDGQLVLNEIFLTPDFGVSVVCDPDLVRFEFAPNSTKTEFSKFFQFKTLDGFVFEPHCYYKLA